LKTRHQGKIAGWLVVGMLGTLFFAFYALFSKLSTFEDPIVVNLIIISTSAISGMIIAVATERRLKFSGRAALSGVFDAIAILIMLYALVSNQVLVVFSFVSFSSVIFFLLLIIFEKPKLSKKQETLAIIGIVVSTLGLFLASTSTAGGVSHLLTNSTVNLYFLLIAPIIPVSLGGWAYLSFVTMKKMKLKTQTVLFNSSYASLAVSLIAFILFGLRSQIPAYSQFKDLYPVIAGLFVMGGIWLTLKSYEMTTGESRIEETIVAILANSEIVPLIFLSYFVLREFTAEGIIGAFTVFIGLTILNSAR
jgi:glucose uptake protein GlcU